MIFDTLKTSLSDVLHVLHQLSVVAVALGATTLSVVHIYEMVRDEVIGTPKISVPTPHAEFPRELLFSSPPDSCTQDLPTHDYHGAPMMFVILPVHPEIGHVDVP